METDSDDYTYSGYGQYYDSAERRPFGGGVSAAVSGGVAAVYTRHDNHSRGGPDVLFPSDWQINDNDRLPDDLPFVVKVWFCVLYVVIMSLAILGNVLVIAVIQRSAKMRTVTNTFLVSLAVSDLCIAALNMPFQLRFYLQNEWTLGEAMCKFSKYMQGVVVVASILTLTAIAIDRYYAIMHPLKARNVHTPRRAVVVISALWLLAFVLILPQVFIQRLEPLLEFAPGSAADAAPVGIANVCVEYFPAHVYNVLYTCVFYFGLYLAPVAVMSVTYGVIARKLWTRRRIGETHDESRRLREKKRIVRMLVVIVILFTLSWFPFFTCQVYQLFWPPRAGPQFRVAMAVLQLLGYSNCCINPFIYCFMNENFQAAVLLCCCKCARRRLRASDGGAMTTRGAGGGQQMVTSASIITGGGGSVRKSTFV